jgi:hypothetical protein
MLYGLKSSAVVLARRRVPPWRKSHGLLAFPQLSQEATMMDFNYALVDFAPAVNRSVSSGGTHFGELYWDHFHNYLDVMHPAAAAIVWEWEDLGNLKLPECDESEGLSHGQVLESFTGQVDAVEDGWAFVTLRSDDAGDVLTGRYPATDLANRGIVEGSRFSCRTLKVGPDEVRVTFQALLSRAMTKEALDRVRKRLALADDWTDDDFREDYW